MAQGKRNTAGQYTAGRQLLTLLLRVGLYRDQWEDVARSNNQLITRDEVNQSAVAKVIANYLYDNGHPEIDTGLFRTLRHKVSRALSGQVLSPKTLEWFVQAFQISSHDAQHLYDLYDGHVERTQIVGSLEPPDPESGIRPPDHRTALLFEHHYVGRDALPVHHHTQQTIYSLVDGLTSYQYRFDTVEAEIRVNRGGTSGGIYPIGHGYYAIDITFPHPLAFGESQYLDYWTNFHYPTPPAPEFRRATHQRVEHLNMRVEFHPEKLPRRLWWAEWSSYLDLNRDVVERKEATLDEERSTHRYLDAIERTVVGFYWEW